MPILINIWGLDKNFIVGLNYEKHNMSEVLINEKLSVKRSSNVLTEFMLPIASVLSKQILLAGFDGRTTKEKTFGNILKKHTNLLMNTKLNTLLFLVIEIFKLIIKST